MGELKRSIGGSFSPQTWNRYPYVLNDPMTKIDPLGGSHQDYDPYFVGCFPDPFFESLFGGFGCGWDDENPCPPGYEAIYGDPRPNRNGGPAIANLNSVFNYANAILGGSGQVALGTNGVNFRLDLMPILGVADSIDFSLGSLSEVESFATWFAQVVREQRSKAQEPGKYSDYLACLFDVLFRGDHVDTSILINLAVLISISGAAPGPGGPIIFGTVATVWDINIMLGARATCTERVYGQPPVPRDWGGLPIPIDDPWRRPPTE